MQILMLQFVDPRQDSPLPVFSHGLGVLASMLRAEGMSCRLATLAGHRPQALRKAVIEHRPRYVLAELTPFSIAAAHHTIVDLSEQYSLPVAVVGPYATCRPTQAASIPGVRALVLGEYETPTLALMKAFRDGQDPDGIQGLWVNGPDGLVRGELGPLVEDLDSLPLPDRDLFDYGRIVQETGEAHFKVARGCGLWCGHCFNDWYMDLYAGRGRFMRRRSVGNVLEEIAAVTEAYEGAESLAFYDHGFTLDADWLKEFVAAYPKRCSLPFRCHVCLSQFTPELAHTLATGGCKWVHTHLGSGSRFIREEILSMHLGNREIIDACHTFRDAGLNIAAEVFVGCPYESEITVEETLELVREADVHDVHPRVFHPTPGTRAAELCRENGWISGRGEEHYWQGRSVLDMPSIPAEHINAVIESFPRLLKRPGAEGVRKLLGKVSRSRHRGIRKLRG